MRRSRGRSDDARADGEKKKRPPLTLRRPGVTLAVAALLIIGIGGLGLNLESRLSPSSIEIPGTATSRANEMLREHFGNTSPFAILLRGPAAELDRQGPALIRTLRKENPQVTTLSPWDRGATGRLRPGPRRALIVADFHNSPQEAVGETVPYVERTLEEQIQPPVSAVQTGAATITRTIQDQSIDASERSELIALPILLIVLFLVFRSPVAAAVPLGFGAAAVFVSQGLLYILTYWINVEALALVVCTMMGLALGVDYALLMVSRFREELANGTDPVDAAWATRRTAGRTTAFAGSTLVLSMMVAFFIVPGSLLASLAGTVALVVVVTVLFATIVGPPVLALIGTNIDRWRIGVAPEDGSRSRLMTLVYAALRRPAPVAAVIGGVVLVLAAPAIALKTGPFSLQQLPQDDPARTDAELISRSIAPGFESPYVIIAAADRGTITEPDRLEALTRWQDRIAKNPNVQLVVGPGQISRAATPLRRAGNGALTADSESGPVANLERLGRSLGQAATGVSRLRKGLSQATNGAELLAYGTGRAEEGAARLATGLDQAAAGGEQLVDALNQVAKGNRQLAGGLRQASNGTLGVKLAIQSITPNLKQNALVRSRRNQKNLNQDANVKLPELQATAKVADEQSKAALKLLEGMTVGQSDPNYGPALEALRQTVIATGALPPELAALQTRLLEDADEAEEISKFIVSTILQLKQLSSVATRLNDGVVKIHGGSEILANGTEKLASRTEEELAGQLPLAADGASRLAGVLAQITGGNSQLAEALGTVYSRSAVLQTGLRRGNVRIVSQTETLNRQVDRLRRNSPGIFDSGYFVLSALDGAPPRLRSAAAQAVDIEDGGQAATLMVTTRYGFNSQGSIDMNKTLEEDAAALSRETGLKTGVAGGAATANTYARVTKEMIPIIVAAITFATFLVLILVLRSIPLAAIAVGLNLATVGVAFGILTMLNNVPEGFPLGGRDYVDAVGAVMMFGIIFGLSIDYAVFLLVRMREHYDQHGDNAAAVEFGLEKTARVITGAAAIMMAVFIAFAGAPIATVSQLGVGLTIAVLLDATVVRIVLLPALMLLIGDRVWWLPRPLERALPRLDV